MAASSLDLDVGRWLGAILGTTVGVVDGKSDGVREGFAVGSMVGVIVGIKLGDVEDSTHCGWQKPYLPRLRPDVDRPFGLPLAGPVAPRMVVPRIGAIPSHTLGPMTTKPPVPETPL